MKYVIVILDGAAGWPLPTLGGATTLEAAHTPNLDALAAEGICGLARTVPAGCEPSSSAACMSILGYDPVAHHIGRGAIEAAARGITLGPDEVALRLNLVTVENGSMLSYCAGQPLPDDARELAGELSSVLDDDTFVLHAGVGYRHILVVKGHPELVDAAYWAPHDIQGQPTGPHVPAGQGTEILRSYAERARGILARSAVNHRRVAEGLPRVTDVWPFWPGGAPETIAPFTVAHGVSAALTSGVDLLNGLAALTGIERLEVCGVTAGPDSDHSAQAEAALAALETRDLVVIHIEAADEAGHEGDAAAKVAAIEAIDREIFSAIVDYAGNLRVLAMPDHPTPVALQTHTDEMVPFVVWGAGVTPDDSSHFSERAAWATRLVIDPASEALQLLLGKRPDAPGLR